MSVREPEKARDLEERGVRVRRGDFDDTASLNHAFEGALQVLIVSSNTRSDSAVSQHPTAIGAAKAAGAGRILYTSHMGSNASSHFPPMHNHAGTEEALRESGVAFTSLRNGFYASPTPTMMLGNALETGELVAPEDGPVAWTTRADLAEAAAIILAGEGIDGPTPALTASEAFDAAGIAAIASEITGRRIQRVVVSDDEYRDDLLPEALVPAFGDCVVLLGCSYERDRVRGCSIGLWRNPIMQPARKDGADGIANGSTATG